MWPLGARAQQRSKVPRVGYLFSFVRAEGKHLWEACRQGLRDLGYVEGQNIILEPRFAEGHHEEARKPRGRPGAAQGGRDRFGGHAGKLRAKAATSTIPIVFVGVGDPVKAGLVANLAQPGGNVTGLSLLTPDLSGKRLSLLMETVRNVSRVAIIMNPDNPISTIFLEETKVAARRLGAELQQFDTRNLEEIEQTFAVAAGQRVDGAIVFDDPVLWSSRAQIVALAAALKIPTVYGYRDFVDEGGLLSYGPDRPDQYRRTARYVDKVLKGAKPSDLPVEQPTKFELIINRKTARSLGIELPASLIVGADELIE